MQNVGRAPNHEDIYLHYMLHKMRRAKTTSRRRYGAEKVTSAHIRYEWPALEKVRIQTLCFAGVDTDQVKEARLSSIVALGKGAGLQNSPL